MSASLRSIGPVMLVGAGKMGVALARGWLDAGLPPTNLLVVDPAPGQGALDLAEDYGLTLSSSAQGLQPNVLVLAVKPQVLRTVCEALAPQARAQRPLVVSIAAGITATQIERWLGGDVAVVRCMPNTPALLGAGVTGLFANARVDAAGRRAAEELLSAAGETVWIDDEIRMDAVTAVSGSGPAYVFLLAEAMQAAALAEGLEPDAARTLVLQTVLGAARMLTEGDVDAAELRRRVTSPNGTTQAAIEAFEAGGFRGLVGDAIHAAAERGRQLSAAND